MLLLIIIAHLVVSVINFIEHLMLVYIILGWFVLFGAIKNRDGFFFKSYVFLLSKIEPLLAIIRRLIPPIMGLDFSALVAFFLLHISKSVVIALTNCLIRLFQ
ncbi:MAG: YggT family protein [Holosporales bacterium]|nr:YggT family protein [Holosporales bacterium]